MTKQYEFTRDGKPEQVSREAWRWEARYTDGSVLQQFDDETGLFHQFAEIDQSQLHLFRMVHDTLPAHVLLFQPAKMKLIHFYRNIVLDYMGGNPQRIRVYCFGYEHQDARGNVHKVVTMITPQEVVVTDNPDLVGVA